MLEVYFERTCEEMLQGSTCKNIDNKPFCECTFDKSRGMDYNSVNDVYGVSTCKCPEHHGDSINCVSKYFYCEYFCNIYVLKVMYFLF